MPRPGFGPPACTFSCRIRVLIRIIWSPVPPVARLGSWTWLHFGAPGTWALTTWSARAEMLERGGLGLAVVMEAIVHWDRSSGFGTNRASVDLEVQADRWHGLRKALTWFMCLETLSVDRPQTQQQKWGSGYLNQRSADASAEPWPASHSPFSYRSRGY